MTRPSGVLGVDHGTVARCNQEQRHRGPDDAGVWRADGAVLGQTRLAIVDLTEAGRQPFHSADGAVSVVFNGEIYNHEELRRRYRLSTVDRCDGAILPQLWQRLGTAMFAQLRGMYAIAVYEVAARTLTLARDPFGIKPLYWVRTAGPAVAFASEPRRLLPFLARPRLGRQALADYLTFGAIGRDQSPFQDIQAVPANGWVSWDASLALRTGTNRQGLLHGMDPVSPARLRDEFLDAVAAHLGGDVPVALLLSAGLDSAAIAWACERLGQRITCVTVDVGAATSEAAGARRVADRFGHAHEVASAPPSEPLVDQFFAAMQRPSIDGLNTFLVSQAIRGLGIKVALSGLGGDELLAGYPVFRLLRYLRALRLADAVGVTPLLHRVCPDRHRKLAALLATHGARTAAELAVLTRRVLLPDQVAALVPAGGPGPAPASSTGRDTSAAELSRRELAGYLGGTLLPDTDAFSMAWSVEVRVPFVDVPLARAALAVDPRRGIGKARFAAWLDDPELVAISRRPKVGFSLPMDRWMRDGPLAARVRAAMDPGAPVSAVLHEPAVREVLGAWRAGRLSWSRAWLLVCLDSWLRTLDVDFDLDPVELESVR